MRRDLLVALLSTAAAPAMAHPSVVPHAHPHGALPELDGVFLVVLLAALAFLLVGRFRRR